MASPPDEAPASAEQRSPSAPEGAEPGEAPGGAETRSSGDLPNTSAPGRSVRASPAAIVFAASFASLLINLTVYWLVGRAAYAELVSVPAAQLEASEARLIALSLLATNAAFLVPAVLLASALSVSRVSRAARPTFVLSATLAVAYLGVDLDAFRSVGRHLVTFISFARLPEGHLAAGQLTPMLVSVGKWSLFGGLLCFAAARGAWLLGARLTGRSSAAFVRTLSACGALIALGLPLLPSLSVTSWRRPLLAERLSGALPVDLRWQARAEQRTTHDPTLNALHQRLTAVYKEAFPRLYNPKPLDEAALSSLSPSAPRPNLVLIVVESLRQDALDPALMPRTTRWAARGVTATQHQAESSYSEAGMFALLYGRSPLVYHATLDARTPPQLCALLRPAGYRCGFFTGHPQVWMRREEFLNRNTLDHYAHDERGDWPDWDLTALENMVRWSSAEARPSFSLVLLMSSHFHYQYPARYEVDRPVSRHVFGVEPRALGASDRAPLQNRYRNTLRFLDDAIMDAVDELDPARHLVVLTGDHGESIFDDGRYTHGYSFAEIITQTALILVGPGVSPARLTHPTSHLDLVPTIAALLGGQPVRGSHGQDIRNTNRQSHSLPAHCAVNRDVANVQLRTGRHRLRLELDLARPTLRLIGFEDSLGRLELSPPLTPADLDLLVTAFASQLDRFSR
ncbi:MAG: sulfatase-like hydrolase/transferase [Polyangiaceae bacterium]|nr:sulfatase-like hydrolase/transferase [Polyangiaceae bacterium]MCW5791490.1 sulfatase-like hydrolase/transferase [Polyangiaceae bacterium]